MSRSAINCRNINNLRLYLDAMTEPFEHATADGARLERKFLEPEIVESTKVPLHDADQICSLRSQKNEERCKNPTIPRTTAQQDRATVAGALAPTMRQVEYGILKARINSEIFDPVRVSYREQLKVHHRRRANLSDCTYQGAPHFRRPNP
jgi:hypothetical protein